MGTEDKNRVERTRGADAATKPEPYVGKPPFLRGGLCSYLGSLAPAAIAVLGAGAVASFLIGASATRTQGATRSARLRWEQQRQVIEAEAREHEAELAKVEDATDHEPKGTR